ASSDPSPFGPHPLAAGTENVLSPWVTGATTMVNSGPFGLAVPFGSNDWPNGIACEMSVFAGCRTIGFASEPMKQLGPRSIGGIPSRWILIGSVMIGTPVESPASRSKSDGSPADETVAKTAIPPAVTMTGSEMTAPPAGDTMLNTLVFESNTMPTCRLVLPVRLLVVPIVMLPFVEFEARQTLSVFTPSAASITGSSTGQRLNGVQKPGPAWNVWSAPVVVPAEFVATTRKW